MSKQNLYAIEIFDRNGERDLFQKACTQEEILKIISEAVEKGLSIRTINLSAIPEKGESTEDLFK